MVSKKRDVLSALLPPKIVPGPAPERFRVRKYRRIVPPRLQMEYNFLAPYTSNRVRTVRLLRRVGSPVTGSAVFGFSIRGGREHGTGFFVSEVGGEARAAGLRVGDQILRVNGYSVEHAIHQEVLKLIQDSNHLYLKVRSVGMIPVKDDDGLETASEDDTISSLSSPGSLPPEPLFPLSLIKPKPKLIRKTTPPALTMTEIAALKKNTGKQEKHYQPQLETIPADRESPQGTIERRCDPLTWQPVSEEDDHIHPPSPSTTPPLVSVDHQDLTNMPSDAHQETVKLFLSFPGRSKLDCTFCRGTAQHPGVFILSIKEGGFAHEAGLRPGDQIIECNGINVEEISFNEAVSLLTSDRNLNLVIRKTSATSSSGYNSSASSVNGDGSTNLHSPNGGCHVLNDEAIKRLSTVSEEVPDMVAAGIMGSALTQNSNRRVIVDKNKNWEEIEHEWKISDEVQQPVMQNQSQEHRVSIHSSFGARDPANDMSEEEGEVKTQEVVAMVHWSKENDVTDSKWNSSEKVTVTEIQPSIPEATSVTLEDNATVSKIYPDSSAGSVSTTLSLSRALSQEIQRRAKRFNSFDGESSEHFQKKIETKEDAGNLRKDLLKEITDDKKMQHSKLMEEFKKAHSKMFANSLPFEEEIGPSMKREEAMKERNLENEKKEDTLTRPNSDNQTDLDEKKEDQEFQGAIGNHQLVPENNAVVNKPSPPPPPPLPGSLSKANTAKYHPKNNNEKPSSIHPLIIQKQTSLIRMHSNDSLMSSSSTSSLQKQKSYTRTISSESLSPRSPKLYGSENNIQIIKNEKSAEIKSKQQPQQQQTKGHVSVTISEYPSTNAKRGQPSKLDFLDKKPISRKFGEASDNKSSSSVQKDWNDVTSQLHSELQQTLSRSKLKAQTESLSEDQKKSTKMLLNGSNGVDSKVNGTSETEYAFGRQNSVASKYLEKVYGPEKSSTEIPQSRNQSNSSFLNSDKILNALANKVTIRIPNSNPSTSTKTAGNP